MRCNSGSNKCFWQETVRNQDVVELKQTNYRRAFEDNVQPVFDQLDLDGVFHAGEQVIQALLSMPEISFIGRGYDDFTHFIKIRVEMEIILEGYQQVHRVRKISC